MLTGIRFPRIKSSWRGSGSAFSAVQIRDGLRVFVTDEKGTVPFVGERSAVGRAARYLQPARSFFLLDTLA